MYTVVAKYVALLYAYIFKTPWGVSCLHMVCSRHNTTKTETKRSMFKVDVQADMCKIMLNFILVSSHYRVLKTPESLHHK